VRTRTASSRGEKGFCDVVVGSELEPDDPVGLLRARGQHDHGKLRARADPPAELEAVQAREHQVEHDETRLVFAEQLLCVQAVARLEGLVALALEVADDDVPDDRLVVDDENGCHLRIVPREVLTEP
jgi:hypothetical protein